MADVKWIKLSTDLFDDNKIKQLEVLPEGDSIICIWLKILCLAGKVNANGDIYFTEEIPYTEQMLSVQFNRPLPIVQMAMNMFQQFGMIDIIDDIIHVSNWEKWQNTAKLEEMREYNRLAQQKSRAKRKALMNVNDMSMTSQECQTIDKDKEEDIDKDYSIKESNKPSKHRFGEYSNVLLTMEEYDKLKNEIPQVDKLIDNLSEYIASKGAKYKSHYATLKAWHRRDKAKEPKKETEASYDLDEFNQVGYKKPVYKSN